MFTRAPPLLLLGCRFAPCLSPEISCTGLQLSALRLPFTLLCAALGECRYVKSGGITGVKLLATPT